MKTTLKTILLALPLFAAGNAFSADLTIAIDDVKDGGGNLMVAVYAKADTFLKQALASAKAPAKAGSNSLTIKDLAPGEYAFAVYHDLNSNGKLDKNMFGMPTEDYAFSNNALGKMGPPSFDSAKLSVPQAGLSTRVTLR
ncbi:MAG: DUF2141 domain-containing protein [Pseudomonadota bacterium]